MIDYSERFMFAWEYGFYTMLGSCLHNARLFKHVIDIGNARFLHVKNSILVSLDIIRLQIH